METTFYILISIKTVAGFESFGRFFIGNNREAAYTVFNSLRGDANVNEKTVLQMELMETENNLPVNIRLLGCTLDELAYNCKMITKEIFRLSNLKEA